MSNRDDSSQRIVYEVLKAMSNIGAGIVHVITYLWMASLLFLAFTAICYLLHTMFVGRS